MNKLSGLEDYLHGQVLGQEDAVSRLSRALEGSESGLNETGHRPKASFLFMGPSGVGKTSSAKAFNRYLFGEERLSMIFMNEMQTAQDVPEFVLSITRAVQQHPKGTVLLFDEIEKAHRAIIDVFISLVDEGKVTQMGGERISIANCYVVMTSNIGAARWGAMEQTQYAVMEQFAHESAKRILRPELFYRLSEVIVYRPLSHETQVEILKAARDRKLAHLESKVGKLSVDEKKVTGHLLRKCFSQTGGARRLQQELDRQLNSAVLPWVLGERVPEKGHLCVNTHKDRLELKDGTNCNSGAGLDAVGL